MGERDQGGDGRQQEEALRDQGSKAFHEGRFEDAFQLIHSSLLTKAIRWFREEGLVFARPSEDLTPTELIVGLAFAMTDELRERGNSASDKLTAATWVFQAAAELRISLEDHVPMEREAVGRKIAELTLRGMMLGQMDTIMNAVELGWLDKLARHEIDRARRRAGAETTNARKASLREKALGAAIGIAARNSHLTNEDIAVKVRESLRISTTIKTLTDWVRGWRKAGYFAPQTEAER